MKFSDKVIVKIQYFFLIVILVFQIVVGVGVISLYLQSREGARNTYCDGVRVRQEIRGYHNQPIPQTPKECLNDHTRLKDL